VARVSGSGLGSRAESKGKMGARAGCGCQTCGVSGVVQTRSVRDVVSDA
jgi:hypothetical protein